MVNKLLGVRAAPHAHMPANQKKYGRAKTKKKGSVCTIWIFGVEAMCFGTFAAAVAPFLRSSAHSRKHAPRPHKGQPPTHQQRTHAQHICHGSRHKAL